MLKMMCSHPPCMNIDVKIVRNAGGCVDVLDRHVLAALLHRAILVASPRKPASPVRDGHELSWRLLVIPTCEVALLARMGDPVRNRPVLDDRLRS